MHMLNPRRRWLKREHENHIGQMEFKISAGNLPRLKLKENCIVRNTNDKVVPSKDNYKILSILPKYTYCAISAASSGMRRFLKTPLNCFGVCIRPTWSTRLTRALSLQLILPAK